MPDTSLPSSRRLLPLLGALGASLAFLLLALVFFGAGGNDDSHITYWPAWTLATRGEILSFNGQALEQSSSLTLVLLLAFLHALTSISVPTLGWTVSMVAGGVAVAWLTARRPIAGLLAASALPLLYWSTSGMESALTALLLLAVVALAERFLAAPSLRSRLPVILALAALVASRPEMPVVALCMTAALAAVELASRSPRRRAALELVGWTVAVSLLLVLFRLAAFGVPLPHPALMKSSGFAIAGGTRYLLATAKQLGWLLPAAALSGLGLLLFDLVRRRRADELVLGGGAAIAGIAFCIFSGGDWMPAGRFLVPVIPFLALLAASAIQRLPRLPLRIGVTAVLVASALYGTVQFARTGQNAGRPHLELARTKAVLEEVWGPLPFVTAELANRAHLRDAALIPAVLAVLEDLEPTPEQPIVLLSGQAGMVPYYLFQEHFGALRFFDLYGLTDDALVRCLPPRSLHRSIWGVGPGEAWLLRHPEVLARCGLPRPDVIYSVSTSKAKREAVRKAGYSLVYEQVGSMRSPQSLFPGGGGPGAYIAVRDDLLPRISLPVNRVVFPLEAPGDRFRRTAQPGAEKRVGATAGDARR